MNKSKIISIIFNPYFGLMPFVILSILFLSGVDLKLSTLIGFSLSIIGITISNFTKHRIMGMAFMASLVLCFFIFVSLFFFAKYVINNLNHFIFGEIFFFIFLALVVIFKTFIKYSIRLSNRTGFRDKLFVYEYFTTAHILLALMSLHILTVVALSQFHIMEYHQNIRLVVYVVMPMLIFMFTYIHQGARSKKLEKKITKEEWLPFISEDDRVIGKVSKSTSVNSKAKYMHPVIRIICKKGNEIYLQKRKAGSYEEGKYDLHIEYFLKFKETAEMALTKLTSNFIYTGSEKPKFLFDYIIQNKETNRKIYTYIIDIGDNAQFNTPKCTGKFWSVKQIDDHFGDEIFSDFFELEYEYVKNLLLTDTSMKMVI